jgi:hypothetical protein
VTEMRARRQYTRRPVDRLMPGQQQGADWSKPTCVYVISSMGRAKIGIATNPEVRMGYLQLACPFELRLEISVGFPTRRAARDVEKALHVQFAAHRLWGEWFSADPTVVVEALRKRELATT